MHKTEHIKTDHTILVTLRDSSLYWHSFYLYWLSKCMQQTKHNAMQVRSNNADVEAAAYSHLHSITAAFTLFQQWERKPTPTNMHSIQSLYLERTCVQFNPWANTDTLTFSWRTESKFAFNLLLLTDDILMDFLALEFWRIFCWWALTFELCPFAFHAATMLHPWKMLWATSYFAK